MNLFKIIEYQLYLFQLENYNLGRYARLAAKTFYTYKPQRQQIVWTVKLKLLASLTVLIAGLIIDFAFWFFFIHRTLTPLETTLALAGILFLLAYLSPLLLVMTQVLIWPLEILVKRRIITAARRKLAEMKNLTVIGIAGSYGKTTAKEVIAGILAEKYRILKTPENINTSLGIAELIKRELAPSTQVLIVEMGEHTKGDIRAICEIVRPNLVVLTGINEAHLERMGSIKNTVETIFELVEYSTGDIVLNVDDALIMENYLAHVGTRPVHYFSADGRKPADYSVENIVFKEDGNGYTFDLSRSNIRLETLTTRLLGAYILGTIVAGVIVGTLLGVDHEAIRRGVQKMRPIHHRLEPIVNPNGTIVIDDSYNGNPQGVAQAISLLQKFAKRRKVYITPGLVEIGPKTEEIHYEIGKNLGKAADLVILIKNSVTDYMLKGLKAANFPLDKIVLFNSAAEAHMSLLQIIKNGDVVLFQNDWPDNYL
jgi:UDP-N-acetylmuramoyl-tripeptide--D-alanyl-D-alanine ligase